jgi:Cu+-exporting ATPase
MAYSSEETNQSAIQTLCKTVSNHFVKIIICFSSIVLIIWSFLIGFDLVEIIDKCKICFIVERAVGVLVVSCPCALGLAVPSVIAMILNLAVKSGILIRKNNVFEKSKNCNIVAFDKTGTLFTQV